MPSHASTPGPLLRVPRGALVRPELPGYHLEELLGTGGSGAVWAATGPAGEQVAVKVLHPAAQAALGAEVDVLRAIDHPHVVRLLAVLACRTGPGGAGGGLGGGSGEGPGEGPGTSSALVLERAAGGSLADLVAARGRLRPGEAVSIVSALGTALSQLHARGLVHGDITPANVLLDASGAPLLSDWGLSAVVGLPGDGPVHGTPGYADPARRAGEAAAPSGDVRGLAATAWAALLGSPPPVRALDARALGAAAGGAGVPRELLVALAAALADHPGDRPGAAELARRCWEAAPAAPVQLARAGVATSAAITARLRSSAVAAPARRASPRRPPRRARAVVAVAVGSLVLVAGALGWQVLGGGGHPARRAGAGASPVAGRSAGASASDTGGAPASSSAASVGPGAALVPTGVSTEAAGPSTGPGGAVASTASTPPAPPVLPTTSAVVRAARGADPVAAVRALASLRDQALSTGDASLLSDVDAAGSLPDRSDRAVIADLAQRGVRVQGRTSQVESARVVDTTGELTADGAQAWVRVRVVTSAHQLLGSAGDLTDVPASSAVTSLLLLSRSGGRWLVAGSG